ncbi:MAG: hypothetical protein LW629_05570 [Burkholderiales bacterium]|jgi:DNA-binding NtrC family response regulator|nr:hypothetical protein [Burkholderiales bacterium]
MQNQNTSRPTAYFLEDDDLLRSLGKDALRLELPDTWDLEEFASLEELKRANKRQLGKIIVSDLNVLDAGPEQVLSYLADLRMRSDVIILSGDEKWVRQLQGTGNAHVFDKGQFDAMENLLKTIASVVKKHEPAQSETH